MAAVLGARVSVTRDEVSELVAEVQKHQSELEAVKVKSARGGTPQQLYEPLSAPPNRKAATGKANP